MRRLPEDQAVDEEEDDDPGRSAETEKPLLKGNGLTLKSRIVEFLRGDWSFGSIVQVFVKVRDAGCGCVAKGFSDFRMSDRCLLLLGAALNVPAP